MSKQYVVVNSQSEFDEVQKILFSMGKQWIEKGKNLINLDYASQYIKVENGKYLYYGNFGACDYAVYLNGYTQISIDQLRTMANQQQGLISGAEAKLAWANGEDVEYNAVGDWLDLSGANTLNVFDRIDIQFRIKPRTKTIKLELYIPAPFVPKHNDWYFFLDTSADEGYSKCQFYNDADDKKYIQFGAWRTEEEVKQVVAALRGALCP